MIPILLTYALNRLNNRLAISAININHIFFVSQMQHRKKSEQRWNMKYLTFFMIHHLFGGH